MIKAAGSFLIVELMRQGYAPNIACEEALGRLLTDIMVIQNFRSHTLPCERMEKLGQQQFGRDLNMHFHLMTRTNYTQ